MRIAYLFSQRTLYLHGGQCAAFIAVPKVQGPLRDFVAFLIAQCVLAQVSDDAADYDDPDYVVLFDVAYWRTLPDEGRARLVYHGLSHVQHVAERVRGAEVPPGHGAARAEAGPA